MTSLPSYQDSIMSDDKPYILASVPQWIKDLNTKYPDGARWNDERGTWEAVKPGDLDFTWHTEELVRHYCECGWINQPIPAVDTCPDCGASLVAS